MENSTSANVSSSPKQTSWFVISFILVVILGAFVWYLLTDKAVDSPLVETIVVEAPLDIVEPEPFIEPVEAIEPEMIVIDIPELEPILEEKEPLPLLNNSDAWLKEKLPTLTWRKELLKLVIDDDMVRRFVVFTDNFSQGGLAYKHSPLVLPKTTFSAIEMQDSEQPNQQEWHWDPRTEKRFTLYIDLLRSFDVESLVDWYIEVKPLINEAYAELGYPDDDFTDTLQSAITRVLDMELPKEPLKVVRPSVMYKYQDSDIEALDDADKLLLRLGKENVLVIKSVLLEFSEKLSAKEK
jgi:hypothetical protein